MSADKFRQRVSSNVIRILRERREEFPLSMTELAQRAGLSQAMISLMERELRKPTLDTLLRVANVLEVDLADVLRQAQKAALKELQK